LFVTGTKTPKGIRSLAALSAAMTLALILAGGFVTTTRTGDTIPTWPKSWGHFEGGWWVEWSHRALAGTVALLVTGLAVTLHLKESRPWVRRIAWLALGAVVVQALIGGLRIHVPRATVAIVHACFGQLVFCCMVAVALFVSETWTRTPVDEMATRARRFGLHATVFAFLQLVAGAVTRHTGAGLPIHLAGAAGVLVFVTMFASRLMLSPVRRGAYLLVGILLIQLLLGLATWAITAGGFVRSHESPLVEIVTISAHVAVGASLLATSLALTLLCHRGRETQPVAVGAVNA
jgi:cytochrome c oxidase assembly protein subunit 15